MKIVYSSRSRRNTILVDKETEKELRRRYNNPTSLVSRRYSFEEFVAMMIDIRR